MNRHDRDAIRELAELVAEIAALPVQEEKRELWRRLNGLRPERPMVMIDQVCWNEMNVNDELTLRCEDADCRGYEQRLRRTLYQWRHFQVDRVIEPFVRVHKAVENSGFGVERREDIAVTDATSDVVSHKFENQFATDADLEKLRMPVVRHNAAETARRLDVAHTLFDGIIEVRPWGMDPYISLWDPISSWMSVEGALYAIIDRPEFVHALVGRMTEGYLSLIDQLEEQGLLCEPQSVIHCTGAYTDELPAPGYDPERPRARDIWTFGLAQMLGTVSPRMFAELEVDYYRHIAERFGLVYYGCCDPLDGKMNEVRRIPNVRKVSMSPWVNEARGAAELGGDYVFSRKPSPAQVATDRFDSDAVRAGLEATRDLCARHGCPLEIILKDISTVRYEPHRLTQFADIAMDVAGAAVAV